MPLCCPYLFFFFFVSLVLLARATALAQTSPSAEELLTQAKTTYEQQGAKPALPKFEITLAAYREVHDRHGEAIVLGLMGNCYKHLGDYPRALELLNSALTMKRELHDEAEEAKTLSNIGLLFWEQSQLSRATENYQAALEIANRLHDSRLEGTFRNNLGLVLAQQGQYRKAADEYQRALSLDRLANFARGEADVLGNIGGVDLELGHYQDALDEYQQSTAVAERAGLNPSVMQNVLNIGLIYTAQGRVQDALASFDQVIILAREQGMQREEADAHKDKGSALLQVGRYDAALQEYRLAAKIYDRSRQSRQKSELLADLGHLYLSIGDLRSAENEFTAALHLARQIGYAQEITVAAASLGEVEHRRGEDGAARSHFHEALEKAQATGDDGSQVSTLLEMADLNRDRSRFGTAENQARNALEIARRCNAPLLAARALRELGEIALLGSQPEEGLKQFQEAERLAQPLADSELKWQLAYGEGRSLEATGHDEEAIKAYRRAVGEIESVRDQLREERFRAGYLQSRYDVYIALVRLLVKLHRVEEAFSFSERLRGRSYLDLLSRKQEEVGPGELSELRARIRHLQAAMLAEQEKAKGGERAAEVIYSEELDKAEMQYQELLDDWRSRSSTDFDNAFLREHSAEEVRTALSRDAAVLEFVVGQRSVVLFCLTSRGLHATSIAIGSAALAAKVELLRDLVADVGHDNWRSPAASLYRQLIGPTENAGWLAGIRQLYIVSHGILHYLPFAVLLASSDAESRFLIERYSIKNLPSASLLLLSSNRSSFAPGNALALAPAQAHLRYAALEAESVAKVFGNGSLAVTGTSATKAAFLRLAASYNVLHFATHGYFNRANPMFSGIQLQPSGADDGTLRVYEILSLRLRAHLVTLSACDTALGSGFFSDLPPGDEFVGLTRAFLAAGGTSVIATLWPINDSSTVRFMRDFYRHAGAEKPERALAESQRQMIAEKEYRHPYYWAPFVISGIGN